MKPESHHRIKCVVVRLNKREHERWKKAARSRGRSVSSFVRVSVNLALLNKRNAS